MLSQSFILWASYPDPAQLCLEDGFQLSKGQTRLHSNDRLAQYKPSLTPAQGSQAGEASKRTKSYPRPYGKARLAQRDAVLTPPIWKDWLNLEEAES